jgi:aryl-alcohol dehydrogenase-like predicted oxidoreductase
MKYVQLGNSSQFVSAIGFGALHLSFGERPSQEEAVAVLHQALDQGITLIDTADCYCQDDSDMHHNEQVIGLALKTYAKDTSQVVVATKGGLIRPGGEWLHDCSSEHLKKAIRGSFEALGGERPIGLWQLHYVDPDRSLQEQLTPVKQAIQDGLVRSVGLSNCTLDQIKQAQDIVEIASVQNQYNPWNRRVEFSGLIDYCTQAGITFLPWSPLGGTSGAIALNKHTAIHALAVQHQVTPQVLILAWMRAKSPAIVLIPGTRRVSRIAEWLDALDVSFTAQEVEQIDRVLPQQLRAKVKA